MKLEIAALVLAATISVPTQAGGLGNVIINAGEVQQGITEQQRQALHPDQQRLRLQREAELQTGEKLLSVVCGPAYGTQELQQKNCTRTYESGRQQNVTCQKDVSGAVNCY